MATSLVTPPSTGSLAVARRSDATVTLLAKRSSRRSCRICLSQMFEPATLNCGHAFCEHCLDQYWEVKAKPSCIVCPLCRDQASKIRFEKADKMTSKRKEFRKAFQGIEEDADSANSNIILVIKILLIIPLTIYIVFMFLNLMEVVVLFRILKQVFTEL